MSLDWHFSYVFSVKCPYSKDIILRTVLAEKIKRLMMIKC